MMRECVRKIKRINKIGFPKCVGEHERVEEVATKRNGEYGERSTKDRS
jgi:hypothetical protein